jgi:Tol biopolymer transport system component
MNADGKNVKALTATPNLIEMNPCISPDGNKIVFTSFTNGQIYVADLK